MTERSVIATNDAPAAIGPYSQAIAVPSFVFVSGQLPIDPKSGQIAEGVAAQTKQSLENLSAILVAGNSNLSSVVKTTVFLKDMNDFEAMNRVYAEYFNATPPARSTVEVARLPRDVCVEIEATAIQRP